MLRGRREKESFAAHFLQKPQGAPRGLLLFYILHRISLGPTHGYEIAQDIEEKTEGAWRPAPGSIYPMLKKLTKEGLIRSSTKKSKKGSETSQRVYEITPLGAKCLKNGKNMFAHAGQRWTAMRRIFIDLLDISQISEFLTEGSKNQFELSREVIETKLSKLPKDEVEFILKEYALNLEKQLNWTKNKLSQFDEKKTPVASAMQVKATK
jgi:DNA-binding PadR family transcriptional regulator